MSHVVDSKKAQASLIDPFHTPEPSADTGIGARLGSTFAGISAGPRSSPRHTPTSSTVSANARTSPSASGKNPVVSHNRALSTGSNGSASYRRSADRERFPDYRAEAFADFEPVPRRSAETHLQPPSYEEVTTGTSKHRRRTSSLNKRFPGDDSDEPLNILRRDSKKAYRSPHLHKRQLPGADMIDRLDPAIGGRAYHHEGPYDAALLSRNRDHGNSPIAALEASNQQALKATPKENIRDAVQRHRPLDGVAQVPPGMADRFGRTYSYEEGTDLMHEDGPDGPGYKRWAGVDYRPEDLKGQGEPSFSLDRALQAHTINDDGIELADGDTIMKAYNRKKKDGTLDTRDPVDISGGDANYAELQYMNGRADTNVHRKSSLRTAGEGLKKRIGSLKHRKRDSVDE